jgi:hypothetical protein
MAEHQPHPTHRDEGVHPYSPGNAAAMKTPMSISLKADLSGYTQDQLDAVADELNGRTDNIH